MGRTRARDVLHLLCRFVPAALLLWSAVPKAFDHQDAILTVDAYDVLSDAGVRVVATLLPWIEIGIAVLLVLGLFTRLAGAATASLSVVFIVAMFQAKARELPIDCGCFGAGGAGGGVSWLDILRDVPILLAGVYLAIRPRGPLQLDAHFDVTEDEDGEDLEHAVEA